MNMLLQILDDRRLTDSTGRTVNFKNTVIIMTSNVGARLITDKKTLGFEVEEKADEKSKKEKINKEYEDTKKEVMGELKKEFRPEFINRIDEIIVFHKLQKEELKQIVDIMLKQVQKRLEENGMKVEISEKVKEKVLEKGVDVTYGARPLKRAIQNMVEDKIAEAILDGKIQKGKLTKLELDKENNIIIN